MDCRSFRLGCGLHDRAVEDRIFKLLGMKNTTLIWRKPSTATSRAGTRMIIDGRTRLIKMESR